MVAVSSFGHTPRKEAVLPFNTHSLSLPTSIYIYFSNPQSIFISLSLLSSTHTYLSLPLPITMADNNNGNIIMNENNELATVFLYLECRRNYGVQMRRYVTDGCNNFMKRGADGTAEAYMCDVCGCHRRFHRRLRFQVPSESAVEFLRRAELTVNPPLRQDPQPYVVLNGQLPNPNFVPPVIVDPQIDQNLGDGEIEDQEDGMMKEEEEEEIVPRKEKRTMLTSAQKEAMKGYADMLEWRLQGHDEDALKLFCDEIGVMCQVFKTWMRNNKSRLFNAVNPNDHAESSNCGGCSGGDGDQN